MKKIIYFLFLMTAIVNFIACDDDEKNDSTLWNYTEPYFEFEYASDTISFGMPNQEMKFAVKELKTLFYFMAKEKMGDYFKGINFNSKDSLSILAQMASGDSFEIHAGYHQDDDFIEVSLNSQDMKALMGDKAALIPPISFRYFVKGEQMTIYFDEVYIQSIFENVQMQNMLLPMLAGMLNPGFGQMSEQAQQGMMRGLKQQISGILDNIQTLKIGFVLTR